MEIKKFKKYRNRKLYSTFKHYYVTLKDVLEEVIKSHKEKENPTKVLVEDNKTKEDITNDVILQALVNCGKEKVISEMINSGIKTLLEMENLESSLEE